MPLEQELKTFHRELPQLLQDVATRGKFALVQDQRIDSIWATQEEAVEAGYERFGIEPFLVKQIVEKEEPRYFSRNLKSCR